MSLTVQQPIGGQLLSGVKSCYILVNESEIPNNKRVMMLVGEIHGKQTCGNSDYVTAYKKIFGYNETTTQESIDVLIEVGNYNVTVDRGSEDWIDDLRNTFQDCYVFNSRDTGLCPYKYTRFHWSDVLWDIPQWMMDLDKLPPFLDYDWRTDPRYTEISKEIKSENDLQKIIFENPHIIAQGERCTIENWKLFIRNQYFSLLCQEQTRFDIRNRLLNIGKDYWWRCGIFDTHRFAMDAYAFLRMFRKQDKQDQRWNDVTRFKNVIYHAGEWHTNNMKQMLLNLNTETAKFRVESETHADDNDNVCCRVDFMEFLETIKIQKQKQLQLQGGSNSKPRRINQKFRRINPKTRRTKPKTRRVKHKTRITNPKTRRVKLKSRRRRYHKYKIFRIL